MTFIKAVLGLQGCGKTMYMTAIATDWHKKGVPIYSNYHLKNIPYTPVNTIDECNKMRDGVFLGDEFYHWIFARSSMTKVNKEMINIFTMNRKRNVSVYYSAQLFRTIDVIIRDLTNYFIYPKIIIINGRKYVKWKEYDLLGKLKGTGIIKKDLEYLGSLYDTNQEIKNMEKAHSYQENGSEREDDFFNYCKKKDLFILKIPNSGNKQKVSYDFIINNKYAVDVKGVDNQNKVITQWNKNGNNLETKIKNAEENNLVPCWAVSDNNKWFMINLTSRNNNYIKYLKGDPYLPKVKKTEVELFF